MTANNKTGETSLHQLLATLQPALQPGDFVFCNLPSLENIDLQKIIGFFKEKEGITVIMEKDLADVLQLSYSYVAAWITLTVHSSLEAVGLTAAFSAALAKENISCNIVAGFYHDHIFVGRNQAIHAMQILRQLSEI